MSNNTAIKFQSTEVKFVRFQWNLWSWKQKFMAALVDAVNIEVFKLKS